jgi:hypothetical protein
MSLMMNPTLPMFETTLPLTKQKVTFRPFVMKEEKILLMAAESEERDSVLRALDQAIMGCTSNVVSCETHPMVDIQHLFLQIRGKSVGEQIEFSLICGNCEAKIPSSISVHDIKMKETVGHVSVIELGSNLRVFMRYPKIRHLSLLQDETSLDTIYNVVADCIEKIESGDEVFTGETLTVVDAKEFIDNLTSMQFEKIREFFDTMPVIQHELSFTCPTCEKLNKIILDEIVNFFV